MILHFVIFFNDFTTDRCILVKHRIRIFSNRNNLVLSLALMDFQVKNVIENNFFSATKSGYSASVITTLNFTHNYLLVYNTSCWTVFFQLENAVIQALLVKP